MGKNKKKWVKAIFPILCFVVVIIVVFSMNDIGEVFNTLKNVKMNYLFMAILTLLIYFMLWPISLCILTYSKKLNIKMKDVFLIASTEHFFNGITPFATGGQPFEVYALKKKKVSLSDSTGLLLMNFVIYQISITLLSVVAFIAYYNYLKEIVSNIMFLMIIGLTINIFILLMFIFLGTLKSFRKLLLKIMLLLSKIKFLKKVLSNKIVSFEHYCSEFQETFKEIFNHKFSFILALLSKIVTMAIYYFIPYFIIKSIGGNINYTDSLFIISMTSFAVCMTCFIPTPGASGGIEFAFKTLFATMLTTIEAVSGMLVWRFITYYLLMIISLVAFIIFSKKNKEVIEKSEEENEETIEEKVI